MASLSRFASAGPSTGSSVNRYWEDLWAWKYRRSRFSGFNHGSEGVRKTAPIHGGAVRLHMVLGRNAVRVASSAHCFKDVRPPGDRTHLNACGEAPQRQSFY